METRRQPRAQCEARTVEEEDEEDEEEGEDVRREDAEDDNVELAEELRGRERRLRESLDGV